MRTMIKRVTTLSMSICLIASTVVCTGVKAGQKVLPSLPLISLKMDAENNVLNFSCSKKVKGIKINAKYRNNKYKATTNKKGLAKIKLKKKLKNGKLIKVKYTKKGYFPRSSTYKVFIIRI